MLLEDKVVVDELEKACVCILCAMNEKIDDEWEVLEEEMEVCKWEALDLWSFLSYKA